MTVKNGDGSNGKIKSKKDALIGQGV